MSRTAKAPRTYAELLVERQQLERELTEAKEREFHATVEAVRQLILKSGFPLYQVVRAAMKGTKRPKNPEAKPRQPYRYKSYKNPDPPGEVWVRTGKMPAWLKRLLKDGHKLEDFEI